MFRAELNVPETALSGEKTPGGYVGMFIYNRTLALKKQTQFKSTTTLFLTITKNCFL